MALPTEMKQIEMDGAGPPKVMRTATGPLPVLKPDEVLIHVAAAGVNRPDIAQRQGCYPPPPGASPLLGLEVAGEIVAMGDAATNWRIGDKVCGLANGGGYAEYCAVPETQCLPWPEGYDAVRAAALPETCFTVWANLFQAGRLRAGERALIHGGSSGIGVTAIQLAKEFGATVYATAGTPVKCSDCVRFGCDAAINYRTEDFAARIKELTIGRGVHVILEMGGGPYATKNIRSLSMDGRLVLIAFLGGSKVENFDLTQIMVRRLTVTGSTMRPRTTAQKAQIAAELREKVWPVLDAGRCAPVIHEVFPLDRVVEAHKLMESSEHIGKIMLKLN